MSFDAERPLHHFRYENEDTSPTTKRELRGWYSYAIAAEVFAVVGLPRERGVLFSDRSKPCIAPPESDGEKRLRLRDGGGEEQCIVSFLGAEVTTASFAMYTTSAAVLTQAVTLVCFSSFADHGPYRKRMLLTFAYTGALISALFIFITPSVYYLAPLLVIVGVTCMGCSFSLLNAFLPLLISNYPDTSESGDNDLSPAYELEALNPETTSIRRSSPENLSRDLERSTKISSKGIGLGYASAVSFQVFSILLLTLFDKLSPTTNNPSLPIRVILFIVGLWWATLTIPTILWLRARPGPPLPAQSKPAFDKRTNNTFLFYALFSFRSFWNTVTNAFRLKQVVLFLVAWFLLSDAIATISGTAVLFARTELHMGTIPVVFLSLTSIAFGMLGAFAWPRIATCFSLTPKTVLILCVLAMEIIPLYGLLGYVPFVKSLGFGGLQRPWEIYPLGVVHGLVMGGINSYARSVFAPLIPEGREAAFFALYAVTDKGSSAFGPALVGWIVDRAGTIRPAFVFLAVLVLLPGPLLWRLDVERGREDANQAGGRGRKFEIGEDEDDDGGEE
ncbi:autophagy-related protein-like protein 22 [Lentithecium fluviatile CBS 122367]|uniref:Autophagy-related protein n=1 Tax=Lentithecium fluviatile CBS 122367 TaxID=1168545 RepID=A0A6G1J8J1_9PLEO|nr:autophagy-related protein-like protein 22 [Lentithecium fluviatile CBS 122367]